jgi:hypothetical protein
MTPRLYYHIVDLIHRYRTWVRVIDTEQRIPVVFASGGCTEVRYIQSLTLQSYTAQDGYCSGHYWRIPLSELQHGVHLWSKLDPTFLRRAALFSLTAKDVNGITEMTTQGQLHLRLDEEPLSI